MKQDILKLSNSVKHTLGKRSPEILTGIGIAGMVSTTILAVKATPKAMKLIEDKKEMESLYDIESEVKLTKSDIIQVAWKPYIPAAVTCTMSIFCLIGASSINFRRNAVLATAYKLSETALTEYRDKVVEVMGEKQEQDIRDAISKDKIDKDPVSKHDVIITGKGDALCYDVIGGRYFDSDINKIRKAENIINRRIMDDMYCSLNDFYSELGLKPTELGDGLGWTADDGLIDLHFSSQISEDDRPCIVVNYSVSPKYDYQKLI